MSKAIKGNARKYALLSKIKSNIEKYKCQMCVYSVSKITVNTMNELKKKITKGLKLLFVPTKLGLHALNGLVDTSEVKISGSICFVFSDRDSLCAAGLTPLLPKIAREELVLKAIYHNNKLNDKIVETVLANSIYSPEDLQKRALFALFKPLVMLNNFGKTIADMS